MRLCLLAMLVAAAGCGPGNIVTGVSDSTFVRTLVALRRLPSGTVTDTVNRARLRDSVLRVHGVTQAQIESAARQLAREPQRASQVWQAIEAGARAPARVEIVPPKK